MLNSLIPIVLSALVLLISLLFFFLNKKRQKETLILILGDVDSGKTTLFLKLAFPTVNNPTCTSVNVNIKLIPNLRSPVKIVDIPGHYSIRQYFIKKYINYTDGIIFLVDSVRFKAQCLEVSEYLFSVIFSEKSIEKKIPVLVLCNKHDNITALTCDTIKLRLEKEINQIIEEKNSQCNLNENLKIESKQKFKFSNLFSFKNVSMIKKDSLENIKEWIDSMLT